MFYYFQVANVVFVCELTPVHFSRFLSITTAGVEQGLYTKKKYETQQNFQTLHDHHTSTHSRKSQLHSAESLEWCVQLENNNYAFKSLTGTLINW